MYLQNNAVDFAIIDDDMVLIQDLNLHFKNSDQVNLKWAGDDYLHFLEHAAHKVDIVLLDIMLGEKSGIELIEPIKTKNEKIQIIMFSVLEDNNILLDCIKRGADGYLLKDTSPDLIISSILDTNRGGSNLSPMMARKLFDFLY